MKKLSIEALIDGKPVTEILVRHDCIDGQRYDLLGKGIERLVKELQFQNLFNERLTIKCKAVEKS